MWHPIAFVAESRRVDEKQLADFAMLHKDKYGIVDDLGRPEVNTWHVDDLVKDFKACQSSHNAAGHGSTELSTQEH